MLSLVLALVYVSGTLFSNLLRSKKLIELLHRMIEFDVTLQSSCVVINYQEHRRRMLLRLIGIYILFVVYFVCHENLSPWINLPVDRYFQLFGCVLLLFNSAMCFLVTELIRLLKVRFAILNKQLNQLVKYFSLHSTNRPHARETFLHFTKICTLHHLLSKSVRLFNDVFGLTLLLMFGLIFVVMVIGFFYATALLHADRMNWEQLVFSLIPASHGVICSLYVCDVCYSTVEEVKRQHV
jgi:hypothetical protein